MPLFHILVLALVQGITELLPISSSGHLILVPELLHWKDQGPAIDIAMHIGSMVAILLYFWKDVVVLFQGFISTCTFKPKTKEAQFFIKLFVASIPAVIVGLIVHKFFMEALRNPKIIIWTLIFYGIVLYFADRLSKNDKNLSHLSYPNALIFGLFQSLALIPGTSRSGITMTAGRLMGFTRVESARFSMLMAIPTILGAGLLDAIDIYKSGNTDLATDAMIAAVLTFFVSYGAIAFLMSWLRRSTFTPFVIYRLLLGAFLIGWFYF